MESNRRPGHYTLEGLPGYTISLENVPQNITPRLLPISDDENDRLRGLKKDGSIGLVTSIAGNLVFQDPNGVDVYSFTSPIRLVYNFTNDDEEKRKNREKGLKLKGAIAEDATVALIPIFLYQYNPDKGSTPEFEVWQPFQSFIFDEKDLTVTIDILFWGDRQIGGGTQP